MSTKPHPAIHSLSACLRLISLVGHHRCYTMFQHHAIDGIGWRGGFARLDRILKWHERKDSLLFVRSNVPHFDLSIQRASGNSVVAARYNCLHVTDNVASGLCCALVCFICVCVRVRVRHIQLIIFSCIIAAHCSTSLPTFKLYTNASAPLPTARCVAYNASQTTMQSRPWYWLLHIAYIRRVLLSRPVGASNTYIDPA
jgi:hypothetical protein